MSVSEAGEVPGEEAGAQAPRPVAERREHQPGPALEGQPQVQLLDQVIVDAVETRPGIDPDRASFDTAYQAASDSVIIADNITNDHGDDDILVGDIGRAVLDDLLPPRRSRTNVRKVKSPLSKYNKKDSDRPERSTKITELIVDIGNPDSPATTRRQQSLTTAAGP